MTKLERELHQHKEYTRALLIGCRGVRRHFKRARPPPPFEIKSSKSSVVEKYISSSTSLQTLLQISYLRAHPTVQPDTTGNMGMPSEVASNAIIYTTYALFLYDLRSRAHAPVYGRALLTSTTAVLASSSPGGFEAKRKANGLVPMERKRVRFILL